jgi:hypothetical protein
MVEQGTISKEDLSLVLLTDDEEEAMNHIQTYVKANYKIKPRKRSLVVAGEALSRSISFSKVAIFIIISYDRS